MIEYPDTIYDIVQFGTSLEKDKMSEVQIGIIFKACSKEEQMIMSQAIKEQMSNSLRIKVEVKSFDLYSFFEPSNFNEKNTLFNAKSLITSKYFFERFNFSPRTQINYKLDHLEKKDKIRFHYLLKGKKETKGLLEKNDGCLLGPGLIEIPPEKTNLFIEKMSKISNKLIVKDILVQKKN